MEWFYFMLGVTAPYSGEQEESEKEEKLIKDNPSFRLIPVTFNENDVIWSPMPID